MFILLDNGHGVNTYGKCSPDKRLREYEYTRLISRRVDQELTAKGYHVERIVPESVDISLGSRCARANRYCDLYGKKNVVLVSIHVNAAGNGTWRNASGFSVFVSNKCSENSKKLAKFFYRQCEKYKLQGNRCVPVEKYWTEDFYILKNTKCPAVLTENLFQDNRQDVDFLLSDVGIRTIVDMHVNAIEQYIFETEKSY